jgi:hypothetical protein
MTPEKASSYFFSYTRLHHPCLPFNEKSLLAQAFSGVII